MPRDLRNYLWDMMQACDEILLFTDGKTFSNYESERMLQLVVERSFITIGEALVQTAHHFPDEVVSIPSYKSFIGFRNILVHQYANIVDENVWNAVELDVRPLRLTAASLLEKLDRAAGQ